MKVARMVKRKWDRFGDKRRRIIRSVAKGHPDANTRCRAQIVMALMQGTAVQAIGEILQCSGSLVYKVAHRFLELGEAAFADRREDNGRPVTNKTVESTVRLMVAETPRKFGRRRPTWTLELLVRVLKQRWRNPRWCRNCGM